MKNYNTAKVCIKCNGVGKIDGEPLVGLPSHMCHQVKCKACNGLGEIRSWEEEKTFESELHDLKVKCVKCNCEEGE